MKQRFNVRVYGILVHEGALLVSDEFIRGSRITKLPGGGMEPGEGTIDCLKREFMEELGLEITEIEHFYTTDFYVASAFDETSQVLSIYYTVKPHSEMSFAVSEKVHDYVERAGSQSFRWIPLSRLDETDFTLVIDRRVAALLLSKLSVNAG